MRTHDESLHPRGQASNAGQFRAKTNDAPTVNLPVSPPTGGELAARAATAADTARTSALYANDRAVSAEVEEMMAQLQATAPADAKYALVSFDEDSWEGAYPHARWLENADGEEAGELDEIPLHSITTEGDMEVAGFERVVTDGAAGVESDLWRIELRAPRVSPSTPPSAIDTHQVHTRAAILGQGGNGFADMLIAATGSDESASNALGRLDRSDLIALTARYEDFLASIADEVKRRDPSDDEAERRAGLPF